MRAASGAGCSAAALVLGLAACGPPREDAALPPARADVERLLAGASTGQPPVVLITIDTLRADRLSSYGSDRVATPHIDRLAAEGIRFANASSTVPFTLPAHSSIMTGLYPPSHGVRENVGLRAGARARDDRRAVPGRGIPDRRLRQRLRARCALGDRPRLRRLRRRLRPRRDGGRQPGLGPAGRHGDDRARPGVARRDRPFRRPRRRCRRRRGEAALLHVAASVRSARPLRAARALPFRVRGAALRRRGGVHGLPDRRFPRRPRAARAVRRVRRRADVGPRRGTRAITARATTGSSCTTPPSTCR